MVMPTEYCISMQKKVSDEFLYYALLIDFEINVVQDWTFRVLDGDRICILVSTSTMQDFQFAGYYIQPGYIASVTCHPSTMSLSMY